MRDRDFDARSSEWVGDMAAWTMGINGDNTERLERLRRNLRKARKELLTDRQKLFLDLYYDQGMTMVQIAEEFGVNCSTVSRTISRAKRTLYRMLQYSL